MQLKIPSLLIILSLAGCSPPTVILDMSVAPVTQTTVKIKQLAGKEPNQNPSACNMPCTLKLERNDSIYEVSLDAPGYYPVVLQLDWDMAFFTSIAMDLNTSDGQRHTPLVIPLIQRKEIKKQGGGRQFRKLHLIKE